MPANHRSPKRRPRPGAGRTTPKGTRPPGAVDHRSGQPERAVDHHLDTSRSANAHGRPGPGPVQHLRTGTRGGR